MSFCLQEINNWMKNSQLTLTQVQMDAMLKGIIFNPHACSPCSRTGRDLPCVWCKSEKTQSCFKLRFVSHCSLWVVESRAQHTVLLLPFSCSFPCLLNVLPTLTVRWGWSRAPYTSSLLVDEASWARFIPSESPSWWDDGQGRLQWRIRRWT